jgi:hypothetical protein
MIEGIGCFREENSGRFGIGKRREGRAEPERKEEGR